MKYADDTSALGLISKMRLNIGMKFKGFPFGVRIIFLELNVKKTKEIVIDFKKSISTIRQLVINTESVEIVKLYKYLDIIINDNLSFNININNIYKRLTIRIQILRNLRKFYVNSDTNFFS